MKTLHKLLVLVCIAFTFSCDPDKGNDTDYLNNRDLSIFFNSNSATLFVEEGAANTFTISVGSTSLASESFNFDISVDPSSTAVEGEDFEITTSNLSFGQGMIASSFTIVADFDNASTEGKSVTFDLVSDAEGINVGTRNKFTLNLFKLCPFDGLNTTSYMANVYAFDEEAPSHNVTLVPVAGTTNEWTIASAWGPTFVSWATGNPIYDNQYLYPATIVLNPDFTVTIEGGAGYATGGSGGFSPCTQVFDFIINQGLFTTQFETNVVLTPM